MDDDQKNLNQNQPAPIKSEPTDDQTPTDQPAKVEAQVETPSAAKIEPSEAQSEQPAADQNSVETAVLTKESTQPETSDPEIDQQTTKEETPTEESTPQTKEQANDEQGDKSQSTSLEPPATSQIPGARWYVVHTYSGHENRVSTTLKQRIESEGLSNKIFEILVPTQDKIEIRNGKKETVKEKIFPGYILVKMILDDESWTAIRTTQGVTSFVGAANKPTPIPEVEVQTIVKFMQQGGLPTYKQVVAVGDTVKIIDGPFADMIGKAEEVDKEKGKVKVLVSIFGRETPVELDFLQVNKL